MTLTHRVRCLRTFLRDTSKDLPPSDTIRWSPRRKARIVEAVRSGRVSLDDALALYKISIDEFLLWQRSIDKHGDFRGLRVRNIEMDRKNK